MQMYSFCLFSLICLGGITQISGGKVTQDLMGWLLDLVTNCDVQRGANLDVSKLNVHFYDVRTDQPKSFPINKAAKDIISIIKNDKNKQIFMFIGGYKTHIDHPTSDLARETFKNIPNSYLIIIDHSEYTHNFDGNRESYRRSVEYVYSIGVEVAKMLNELHKGGINAKGIHAIGHSLGAQILGHVGHNFITMTNGQKIARITALDPAGPCFSDRPKEEQIRAGVADYVEVYHCDDGFLGTKSRFGDVDFYMNKGFEQPQCKSSFWKNLCILKPKICSHKVCVAAWMSTVIHRERFPATQCDSYESFKQGNCAQNSKTIAGFSNPGTAKGTYYFSTKEYEQF